MKDYTKITLDTRVSREEAIIIVRAFFEKIGRKVTEKEILSIVDASIDLEEVTPPGVAIQLSLFEE